MGVSYYLTSLCLLLQWSVELPGATACTGLSGVPSVPVGGIGGGGGGGGGGADAQKRCLHADSQVLMADGTLKNAGDLRVGDLVWSKAGQPTAVVLTPVADLDDEHTFVRFQTKTGHRVTLTADHAVFARPCAAETKDNWPIKRSIDLVIGECVPTVDGKEDQVVSIRSVELVGLVQPITQTGAIAVESVLVSCYDYSRQNDTQEQRHAPFEPARMLYNWAEKIHSALYKEEYALSVIEGLISGTGLEKLYYK